MVDHGSPPCGHLMATEAGSGIAGAGVLLLVIGLVAGDAVFGAVGVEETLGSPRDMAARAGQEAVVAQQAEPAGQSRVVGGDPAPSRRVVAKGAAFRIPASRVFPLVVGLMTGRTVVG